MNTVITYAPMALHAAGFALFAWYANNRLANGKRCWAAMYAAASLLGLFLLAHDFKLI